MWPTPTVQDGKNNAGPSQFERNSAPLNVAVVMYPTPTAKDANGPWRTTHSPSLNALLFPTPRVNSLCGGTGAWNAIHGNPALTADEKRAMTSTHGQLNPDWVEWLMGWLIGYTDAERASCESDFRPLSDDPADLPPDSPLYLPRTTTRRRHRAPRIKVLGNGQVPRCAAVAFEEGLATLARYAAFRLGMC